MRENWSGWISWKSAESQLGAVGQAAHRDDQVASSRLAVLLIGLGNGKTYLNYCPKAGRRGPVDALPAPLTVSSSGARNSPQVIPVKLHSTPPPQ